MQGREVSASAPRGGARPDAGQALTLEDAQVRRFLFFLHLLL